MCLPLEYKIFPIKKDANIKPIKKPKLGLKKDCIPPLKPENIGRPTNPKRIYIICDNAPNFGPSKMPDKSTINVCNVIITGPTGIAIKAPRAVREAKSDASAICFTDIFNANSQCKPKYKQ